MARQTNHIGDTNKMVTAVEWLIEKQLDAGYGLPKEWREQAKAMEKEQIIDAWLGGEKGISIGEKKFVGLAEQYYNEKYGKDS